MTSLLKIHWDLMKRPSESLKNHILNWPVKLGVGVFAFSLLETSFGNGQTITSQINLFSYYFENFYIEQIYWWQITTTLIEISFLWYVMPLALKFFVKISQNGFDPVPYRKLVFYAPVSFVIFTVIFVLPMRIIVSILTNSGMEGTLQIVILALFVFLEGLLGIWSVVALTMGYVMVWKGLKSIYNLNSWQVVLIEFVFPSIIFVPISLVMFPNVWNYIKDFVTTR